MAKKSLPKGILKIKPAKKLPQLPHPNDMLPHQRAKMAQGYMRGLALGAMVRKRMLGGM